jgi:hypothetical protein
MAQESSKFPQRWVPFQCSRRQRLKSLYLGQHSLAVKLEVTQKFLHTTCTGTKVPQVKSTSSSFRHLTPSSRSRALLVAQRTSSPSLQRMSLGKVKTLINLFRLPQMCLIRFRSQKPTSMEPKWLSSGTHPSATTSLSLSMRSSL